MDALRSLAAESPADGDGGPEDPDAHNKRLALMMFAGLYHTRSLVRSTSARGDGSQGERLRCLLLIHAPGGSVFLST